MIVFILPSLSIAKVMQIAMPNIDINDCECCANCKCCEDGESMVYTRCAGPLRRAGSWSSSWTRLWTVKLRTFGRRVEAFLRRHDVIISLSGK